MRVYMYKHGTYAGGGLLFFFVSGPADGATTSDVTGSRVDTGSGVPERE